MDDLADVSLDSDTGPWPAPLQPVLDGPAVDLPDEEAAPAVPTGAWGRPAALRRPEPRPAEQEGPWPGLELAGPQPAPPGARPKRRHRARTALAEGVIAVVLVAVLAFVFAPRTHRNGWEVGAAPVLQSLLNDVAMLSRSPGNTPPSPSVSALGGDLERGHRLGAPSDPLTARLWDHALVQLDDAYTKMRASGTVGPSIRADLTSAGDALLELALQH